MPNIREYTNPVEGLKPDNGMEEVAARTAAHIDDAYSQLGRSLGSGIAAAGQAYVKIKTQQDISHGLAASAKMMSANTTNWQQTINSADPNDHSTGDKWMTETLEPQLQQYIDAFSTQEGREWATQHAAQIRNHFSEKIVADQAIKAGQAAVQNYHDTVRGLGDMSLQDPTSMTMSLGLLDKTIDAIIASDPNLTAEQAASIRGNLRDQGREEIAKSAFIGSARANPDAAMKDIQDGKYNGVLDGTTQNQMFGFAETIKREARADARAQTEVQRQAQKDDFNTKRAALEAALFQPDGSVKVPPGFHQQLVMLSHHPGASQEPGAIQSLGDAAARATKDSIEGTYTQTDNATWQGLASRIGLPPGDPHALDHTDVNKAYAAGLLSKPDWQFLHQAVESSHGDPALHTAYTQLNQALERIKPLVGKPNIYGQLDQSGTAHYAELHYDVFQRFNQLVASGKSPTEAEQILEDPRDPRGIRALLPGYQTDNKQGMKNIHDRVSATGGPYRGPPAANAFDKARKPGESAADFLKRTGG